MKKNVRYSNVKEGSTTTFKFVRLGEKKDGKLVLCIEQDYEIVFLDYHDIKMINMMVKRKPSFQKN